MYRTHTCGELRLANAGQKVTLAGWVQRVRKMGGMSFIDLRDRYGITQIIIDESASKELNEQVEKLRERLNLMLRLVDENIRNLVDVCDNEEEIFLEGT